MAFRGDMNRKCSWLILSIIITVHTFHTSVVEDLRIEQNRVRARLDIIAAHAFVKATLRLGLQAPFVTRSNCGYVFGHKLPVLIFFVWQNCPVRLCNQVKLLPDKTLQPQAA